MSSNCSGGMLLQAPITGSCSANGGNLCGDLSGPNAGKCVACSVATEVMYCTSFLCLSEACAPNTCVDGMQDGNEVDVDCGGSCAPCAVGRKCTAGTDCGSGQCTTGVCTATMLDYGPTFAIDIKVDSAYVYWIARGTASNTGAIWRISKGGGQPVSLASSQVAPSNLTVDATNVYWTNFGLTGADGTVNKAPIAVGSTTTLAMGQMYPTYIMVDGTSVYWAATHTFFKAPIGGGMATTLAGGINGFTGMTIDATSIYWSSNDGDVNKATLGGASVTQLASAQSGVGALVVDTINVYWANGPSLVEEAPPSGGTPILLAIGGDPRAIAVDGTSLYWIESTGQVMKTNK
jgi:hypothetical protein